MKIKFYQLVIILVASFLAYTSAITLFYSNNAQEDNYKDKTLPRLHQDALDRYAGGLKIKTISNADYEKTNFCFNNNFALFSKLF